LEVVLVVQEQEQVLKLRKGRGGVVWELAESKEETWNKVARFATTTTETTSVGTNKGAAFSETFSTT
jgi:hypothetical protein